MSVDLAPLRDLLNHLNNPQKQFRTIHIAGTKGKRSVGALIEAGLDRAGLVCGRFSSPQVERITERITFGGKEISEAMLATMMKHAWLARESAMLRATAGRNATRFDFETLTAILAFVDARVTWAVVECGLGGRVDSTNVIDGEVCLLTNVGLEHTAVLGTTHAAIAFQKVGILKRGATMITGVVPDCAARGSVAEIESVDGHSWLTIGTSATASYVPRLGFGLNPKGIGATEESLNRTGHHELLVSFAASLRNLISPLKSSRSHVMR